MSTMFIPVNREVDDVSADITGWTVRFDGKNFRVREVWNDHNEVWSDGVTVTMPPRVAVEVAHFISITKTEAV